MGKINEYSCNAASKADKPCVVYLFRCFSTIDIAFTFILLTLNGSIQRGNL